MVHRSIECFHESVFIKLLLEVNVGGDVCNVEDLALLVVLEEVLSLHYESLGESTQLFLFIDRLHLIDLVLIFFSISFVYDFFQRLELGLFKEFLFLFACTLWLLFN